MEFTAVKKEMSALDDFEFSLEDLKPSAKDRLLRRVMRMEANRRLPMHKRDKDIDDPDTADQDEEMEKTADLHAERGKPSPVPVTEDDFSEDAAIEIAKSSKKKTRKS